MKIRARITRRLIAPFNWHRNGYCRFPVLCMYDDLLIAEMETDCVRRARWRDARRYRHELDQMAMELQDKRT